jgi:4-amino-4-deoxy-L-arabinose transferase-like glycosyltransferase
MIEEGKLKRVPADKLKVVLLVALPALLAGIHLPYLRLPFHWDEVGQFVPAALDILRGGHWVPQRTLPNVHPPGVMAILALVWRIFGFSILSSRLTMLALAALGVALCFLLTLRLTGGKRTPALAATLFLIAAPIFYTQSMMALLDMPAMTFTLLALLLFLDRRYLLCSCACAVAALMKETAITTPVVFAAWLWLKERKRREALYFVLPPLALGVWLLALHSATGRWLGNEEFAQFNVASALNPYHLGFAVLARLWFLFVADGHFIGTIALIVGWRLLRGNEWRIALLVAAAQAAVVTVFGGAELERYLVPALPVLYAAMAAAAMAYAPGWRWISHACMLACLVAGWFWSTPSPWPYEDNLDMVDFVRLQQSAADYLQEREPTARILTAWPLSDNLQYPEMGYVTRPLKALKTPGLHLNEIAGMGRDNFDVLVMFTNKRPVKGSLLDVRPLQGFLRYYYDYEPQASANEIREGIGFVPVKQWRRGDQWMEIYVPEAGLR